MEVAHQERAIYGSELSCSRRKKPHGEEMLSTRTRGDQMQYNFVDVISAASPRSIAAPPLPLLPFRQRDFAEEQEEEEGNSLSSAFSPSLSPVSLSHLRWEAATLITLRSGGGVVELAAHEPSSNFP